MPLGTPRSTADGTQLVDEVEQVVGWHRVGLVPGHRGAAADALDVYAPTPSETEVLGYLTASGWTGFAEGPVAVVRTKVRPHSENKRRDATAAS